MNFPIFNYFFFIFVYSISTIGIFSLLDLFFTGFKNKRYAILENDPNLNVSFGWLESPMACLLFIVYFFSLSGLPTFLGFLANVLFYSVLFFLLA